MAATVSNPTFERLHIVAFDRNGGSVSLSTKIGNVKKTIDGDFIG